MEAEKKQKTPKWLKRLETQSWQAELLISGLVVAGLFQLPDFFIRWVEGYILESSEIGYVFLSFASLMILAGIDSLIILFGLHFLFRAIWVALLGLNSVYPEGIDVNSTNGAGPKSWAKAKEKYPNLSAYNLELDKKCSLIFSLATVTIIMMTSLSVVIMLVYQVFRFLISVFPSMVNYVIPIGIGIYIVFALVSFGAQYLAKKYPDNKRVEKWIDAYGKGVGSLFSLFIFQKPIGYITSIYTSNVKSKLIGFLLILFSGFLGFAGGRQTSGNPIYDNFGAEKYVTFNNKPAYLQPYNYENMREEGAIVFTPIIPSDVIKDDFLKVFIPTIEREKEQMNLIDLGLWKRLKLGGDGRDSLRIAELEKYAAFNQVFINEKAYTSLDFQYFSHPNATERGVMVYIPTNDFVKGKNVLEIRKNYFSKEGVQKIVAIPFFFEE